MGGSTVLRGAGAPDWGTLPAYIQTDVRRASDRPVCVVNYGESAYVSTQSVLRLLLRLRAGHVPGSGDPLRGSERCLQRLPVRPLRRSREPRAVRRCIRAATRKLDVITGLMRQTNLFAVVETVVSRITRVEEQPSRLATYRSLGVDEKELAASIAETYLANYEVVEALATKYKLQVPFLLAALHCHRRQTARRRRAGAGRRRQSGFHTSLPCRLSNRHGPSGPPAEVRRSQRDVRRLPGTTVGGRHACDAGRQSTAGTPDGGGVSAPLMFSTIVEALSAAPPEQALSPIESEDTVHSVTFGEFARLARQQAHHLREQGLQAHDTMVYGHAAGDSAARRVCGSDADRRRPDDPGVSHVQNGSGEIQRGTLRGSRESECADGRRSGRCH